jgi:hypothetical protein
MDSGLTASQVGCCRLGIQVPISGKSEIGGNPE